MPDHVLHTLWSWHPMAGITLGRHVFLKKQFQGDRLLLAHELVHVRQMSEMGTLWYLLQYFFLLPLFWSPFRVRVEAEAYAVDAQAGCPIDGDNGLAAKIACWRYGWPCSRQQAADAIRRYMSP